MDLADLPVADWGDLPLEGCDLEEALRRIADAAEAAAAVALPVLRRYPALQVVHIDAHADLRDEYEGRRLSHATVMRRVADEIGLDRIAQYGVRSGTREELDVARKCLYSGQDLLLTRPVRDRIHTRPVYVSIDIDVLDPSCAPGTGCPEPGGPSFSELLSFLHSLRDLNVVAVDITEVLPAADVNDITSIAAAKLAREAALAFGKR
jgi:agmatinase